MKTTPPCEYQVSPSAPYLAGRFSLQSIAEKPDDPDVTVYRMAALAAESWKNTMLLHGGFDGFLLRHSVDQWDVYDGDGLFVTKTSNVVRDHAAEIEEPVTVERDTFLEEARGCLDIGGLSLLAVAEGHAGASAADHSNFVVLCRRMILDAKPADLERLFVVESKRWPCPVMGLFADVSELSAEMRDVYIERWKWLDNGWPLISQHHRDTLADRMARLRGAFVRGVLEDCGRAAGKPPEVISGMHTKWCLASTGAKYRFAQHVVKTLADGIIYEPGEAEKFDPDIVERRGADVVKDYKINLR